MLIIVTALARNVQIDPNVEKLFCCIYGNHEEISLSARSGGQRM